MMVLSLPISVSAIAMPFPMMLCVIAVMPACVIIADTIIIGVHVIPAVYVLASRTHAAIYVLLAAITQAVVTDAVIIGIDVSVAAVITQYAVVLVPSRANPHRTVRIVRVVRCDAVHVSVC